MILAGTDKENAEASNSDSDDDDAPGNSGMMIVDATCAPSNIKYPQGTGLLNEARENTEAIIHAMHIQGNAKPRTYRIKAHRVYFALVKSGSPQRKRCGNRLGNS